MDEAMNSDNLTPKFGTSNENRFPDIQVTDIRAGQATRRAPVAAVIRPLQQVEGTTRSVRVDAAQPDPGQGPHLRSDQLANYVSWLNEQARRETPQSAVVRSVNSAPAVSLPSAQQTSPRVAIQKLQRVDQPHSQLGKQQTVPEPKLAAPDFQFEADLERILKKLNMPEILLPSSPAKHETPADPFQGAGDQRSSIGSPESRVAAKGMTDSARAHQGVPMDTDEIIRQISQAIASVLTDQSETVIESNIRQHMGQPRPVANVESTTNRDAFDDLHRAALNSLPPDIAQQIVNDVPDKTASLLDVDVEIPASIAAWDVEDFRWPKVSNQMVSVGSKAIEALANSVFQTLGPNQKRVAITSPGRGVGSTSIAISLARWAASGGQRVLLVDADLARPGLSAQVGLGPNISWVNAIVSSLNPAEVIIRSQQTSLCIMPLSPIVTRVGWPRFIYDQLGDLINQVAAGFDLVVFDIGPANQLISELSQSRFLVEIGLIVHAGNDTAGFLQTKDRLETFGLSRFVVAQNGVQQNAAMNVA